MKTSTSALLRSLPPVNLQDNLMGCADRDLAMWAVLLEPTDEALFLGPLSPRERLRVQEEAALIEELWYYDQMKEAMDGGEPFVSELDPPPGVQPEEELA